MNKQLFAILLLNLITISIQSQELVRSELPDSRSKPTFPKYISSYQVDKHIGEEFYIHKKAIVQERNETEIDYVFPLFEDDFVVFEFKRKIISNKKSQVVQILSQEIVGEIHLFVSNDEDTWEKIGIVNNNKKLCLINIPNNNNSCYQYLKLKRLKDNIETPISITQVAILNPSHSKNRQEILQNKVICQHKKVLFKISDQVVFDGDIVSVKLNGNSIYKKKVLTKWNRRIELELEPGENILQVKAHNEGLIKSNTPFIEIIDGITIHEGALVLRKGKMKKITIVKI